MGGEVRESRGDAVGARERLPVGCGDVLVGGAERAPRDTAVGARERLPVGPSDVRERDVHAQLRVVIMGAGERRTALATKRSLQSDRARRGGGIRPGVRRVEGV